MKALSSTYACQNCCGDFAEDAFITPSQVEMQAGQSIFLQAFELRSDCYGFTYPVQQSASWSSSNSSIASVSGGQVTASTGGETTIKATWNSFSSVATQCSPGSGILGPDPIGTVCCRSVTNFRSATATVQVRPRIDRIDPPRGVVGFGRLDVTIEGAGFGNNSSVVTITVGGTGITPRIDQVTQEAILASFTIGANAGAGNHSVSVRVNGVDSNSVNFFVQVPTRLRRDSISGLMDQQGGCGVTRTLVYTLLDQAGQPINSDGILRETISNYSGPEGLRPPPQTDIQMDGGRASDIVGYGTDSADCPPPFTATFTQTFRVTIGTQSYPLSTTNSMSMGRTTSGTKFVNVTITNP